MSKVMIALGGNALGNTPQEQLELVKETAVPIADLIEEDTYKNQRVTIGY